ncbi:hypothetical protein HBI71_003440 [Parastagonospora nodorum]|nr:hypothetical protein HBI71_003440 [Parastagonospora nodorum]KAH5319555.1 hypothetical protein HBI12_114010 [Parastagonospora nodorum]KAH5424726.1 hypothetical protein HBI47_124790 [Parastagonospora nodorum]
MISALPAIWTALCCASPRNSKLTYHSAGLPMVATQLQPYHSKSSCTSAMAEVAGTIFGFISLSIQIFDKVSKYTSAVKDAKTKAEQILAEMEYVADLLEELEPITNRACADKSATSAKRGVYQCAQAIEMVKLKLGGDKPVCAKPWTKFKNTFRRLMFPFKEADIKYWKDVLSYIQQHLQTALFALLLDQGALNLSVLQAQISGVSSSLHERIHGIDEHIRRLLEFIDHLKLSGQPLQIQDNTFAFRDDYLVALQPTLQLQQQIQAIHELQTPRSRKLHERQKNTGAYICTCYGTQTAKRILKRPFFWTQATFHTHSRGCPFWSAGGLRTNITFGLILCYLALGLQWRMILTLSINTGPMSILPGWRCYRAVKASSSPAFQTINTIVRSAINAQTIPCLFRDLRNIFDTQRASVDDRLQNGQTLLHYLCQDIGMRICITNKSQLQHYRSLLRLIFDFVGKDIAAEIDDKGNTCVDLLLRATDPADEDWSVLVSDLLQAGLQLTPNCHPEGPFQSYGSWVEIPFESFADPFSHCNGPVDIMMTRSDHRLEQYLQELSYTGYVTSGETHKLYKLGTRMGWVVGCEMLLEAGLAYIPRVIDEPSTRSSVFESFLNDAVKSRNSQMVLFWLKIRDDADTDHLLYIGNVETALVYASEVCHNESITEVLLSHLVGQRKRLQQLGTDFGIVDAVFVGADHLLDMHAACVVQALTRQGVEVPPSIRPFGRSVYSVRNLYQEQPAVYQKPVDPLWIFQRLYDSGFKQIAASKCSYCSEPPCPPLVIAVTLYRKFPLGCEPMSRFFKVTEWFVSHGADLLECWPNSNMTTLHCMASKAALIGWRQPMDRFSSESLMSTLSHRLEDTCKCSCSINGCTALVSFWKASYRCPTGCIGTVSELLDKSAGAEIEPSTLPRMHRWELEHEVRRVEKAVTSPAHRWIAMQFIRFLVFSLLGIRHTCCDLAFRPNQSDFDKKPCLRYSPKEVEVIQGEDESLRVLLEVNIELMETAYIKYKGGLQGFIDEYFLPRMSYVLGKAEE